MGTTDRSRYQLGRKRGLPMIFPPQKNLHIMEDHSSYRQLERNVETEIFLHILGKQMIKCLHLHVKIKKNECFIGKPLNSNLHNTIRGCLLLLEKSHCSCSVSLSCPLTHRKKTIPPLAFAKTMLSHSPLRILE